MDEEPSMSDNYTMNPPFFVRKHTKRDQNRELDQTWADVRRRFEKAILKKTKNGK